MDMSILEAQSDVLFGNVAGWEQSVLNRIAKRINAVGKMSVADVKALNNIAFVKQDMKEITKELAKMTKMNVSQIEKIYGDTIAQQHLKNSPLYDYRNKKFVPFADNKELQAIVHAYSKTTAGNMVNLSTIGASHLGVLDENSKFKPIEKFYTDALDKAVMQVASGSTDFHTAMRDVIQAMGGSGIRVSYPGTDITRRLDTAIRQSLLWGAKQASVEYNEMIGEELGCDGIEIDWHAFPRPSHEFMQGKQYVLGKSRVIGGIKFESADDALRALTDYGCLHYKTPIICGISEPRYSEQELADLNKGNAQTFDIDGKQMSGYEAKQAMRRLETAVREQKTTREVARNADDKVLADRCTAKIKAYQAKYNEISEKTGIAPSPKRMSVPKGLNSVKSVDFSGNGGIMLLSNRIGEKATPYPPDKVPEKINTYLSKLNKYGDEIETENPISFADIALMSRQAGTEFASVTINGRHYIVKGDEFGTRISKQMLDDIIKHEGTLNCHSHPYIGDLQPSKSDMDIADLIKWQNKFVLVTPDMKIATYTKHGIIDVEDIKNEISEEEVRILKKLFGGD